MPKVTLSLSKTRPVVSASIIIETKRGDLWIRAENKVLNSDGQSIDLVVHQNQRILIEAIGEEEIPDQPVRPVTEPQTTQPTEKVDSTKPTSTQPTATTPASGSAPANPAPPAPPLPAPKP